MKYTDLGDKGPDFIREMDSQGYTGSRDGGDPDAGKKQHTSKSITADKMMKDAHDAMMRSMSQKDKVKKGWAHPDTLKKKDVEEAFIPYALSAANYNAEFERQTKNRTSSMPAGGGYRGRVELDVESREDYIATGKTLAKAAKAAGQHIEYGLSGGVMKVFSDSMTSDELEDFIDDTLENGLEEGFKNTYNVGDRVDGPLGTGTIVAVSPNINVDGEIKVKLDDPSRAGEDGKERDTFVLNTTQVKHIADEASLAQMRDYFNQADTDSVKVDRNYDAPSKKQNPLGVPPEIQALVNKMYHAGKISPQEFEVLRKFQQKTKINVGIREADKNPYAIGMAQAMKSTGDKPPLKKSTINKAHEIARAIKKDQ